MKLILTIAFLGLLTTVSAQNAALKTNQPDSTKKIQVCEASCGECQFHLEGKGCRLQGEVNTWV